MTRSQTRAVCGAVLAALAQDVFARPGLAQRVLEAAGDDIAPLPGPSREQVLQLVR